MVGLPWGQANFRSGYCPVGRMSGPASVHGLLSGQVTVQSGYCPVRLLSSRATVFRVSVNRVTACRGYALEEVSIGLVSGRATVRIPIKRICPARKNLKQALNHELVFKKVHGVINFEQKDCK